MKEFKLIDANLMVIMSRTIKFIMKVLKILDRRNM